MFLIRAFSRGDFSTEALVERGVTGGCSR